MDFLDPAKKRAHHVRLFIGYILIGIAVATGSLVLALATYGYGIDRQTGNVIQNGLVFIAAHPVSADIYLNGNPQHVHTDTHLLLPAGQYSLQLKKAGYRTWERGFTLEGGSVERYDYPLLFPEKLTPKDVQLYSSAPVLASVSLDRNWLLVQPQAQSLSLDVLNLSDANNNVTTLALPVDLFTASVHHQLAVVAWASDNRHILLSHNFDEGHEFILIDRQSPSDSLNLSRTLGQTPTRLVLRDGHFDQYYIYDGNSLKLTDLKAKTPTPLLDHVLNFATVGPDTILYASDASEPADKVGLRIHDSSGNYTLREVSSHATYTMDLTRFNGVLYAVAGASSENRAYVYKDPLSQVKQLHTGQLVVPVALLKANQPQEASFSLNGRFGVIQGGNQFAVYDAQTNRYFRFDLKETLDSSSPASWMDSDRLVTRSAGHTLVFDYDGTNAQSLSPTLDVPPAFNHDYTALYTVAPAVGVPGRFAITRADLKASP